MGKALSFLGENSFREFVISDDFTNYASAQLWTSLAADAGTSVAAADAAGGTVVLTTGATDNNECTVATTKEMFKYAAEKPFFGKARLQYTEANTDDANVAFGFADAAGSANVIVDNGAGMKASYSGAVVFKVDGGTVWKCQTSIGGTQKTTDSVETAGGASYQTLAILVEPVGATVADVSFHIDPEGGFNFRPMKDANGLAIKHRVTFSGATEMNLFIGAKAGSANSEVVNVDYLYARGIR